MRIGSAAARLPPVVRHRRQCLSGLLAIGLAALALRAPQAAPEPSFLLRGIAAIADAGATHAVEPAAGLDLPPALVPRGEAVRERLAALLGRPIDGMLLEQVQSVLAQHFVAIGQPLVDIHVPPQDVTDGTLRVVVTRFTVGQVRVDGNRWHSDRLILRAAGLVPGMPIDKQGLDRRLAAVGDSPFLSVRPEFTPGSTPGTTDVTLAAEDRLPVRVTLGYGNKGNARTGWDRWELGGLWGNAFGTGASFGYQVSTNSDLWSRRPAAAGQVAGPRFAAQSARLSVPLTEGDRITLSGTYARQSPSIGPDMGAVGITLQAGLDYSQPLQSGPGAWLGGSGEELSLGWEFKRSNNDLSFGGQRVQRGYSLVAQLVVRWSAGFPHALGVLQLQNTLTLSPGGIGAGNTDRAFQPQGLDRSGTPGARARYAYNRLVATQLVPLPGDLGLVLRGTVQGATAMLLPSEQMPIAGMDSVRGYQEFAVAGAQGMVLSAELRSPRFSPSLLLLGREGGDSAQLHVFADAGRAWNPRSAGLGATQHTSSFGAGARMAAAGAFTVHLEQGWQTRHGLRGGPNGAFLHVALSAEW